MKLSGNVLEKSIDTDEFGNMFAHSCLDGKIGGIQAGLPLGRLTEIYGKWTCCHGQHLIVRSCCVVTRTVVSRFGSRDPEIRSRDLYLRFFLVRRFLDFDPGFNWLSRIMT